MSESLGTKIKSARIKKGLTQKELAALIGAKHTAVSNWENDINKPDADTIELLCTALGVEPNYFFNTQSYRDNPVSSSMEPITLVHVPIVGRVSAGNGCYAQEDIEGYEAIPADLLSCGRHYVLLRVKGDSMSPKILEGDLVLIQCQQHVDSGSLAVVIIDNEDGVIKRIKYDDNHIELVSENPYYPPRIFRDSDMQRIKIVGLVKRIIRDV